MGDGWGSMFEVWCGWGLFLGLFVPPLFILQLWLSPVRIGGGYTFIALLAPNIIRKEGTTRCVGRLLWLACGIGSRACRSLKRDYMLAQDLRWQFRLRDLISFVLFASSYLTDHGPE